MKPLRCSENCVGARAKRWCHLVIEILLTAWDFVIEDKTRLLSPTERVTHLVLSMTGGAYVAFLIPVLIKWSMLPSDMVFHHAGLILWILCLLGLGVFAWGIRDLWSGLKLSEQPAHFTALNRSQIKS